ncbi:MAG: efflux RND transporter periplasmic adaptor subunit [Planctomycetes bacterium]|nr:efflux RND transporter periplasmic adaptor subunit [Planctomycetota bacterium]
MQLESLKIDRSKTPRRRRGNPWPLRLGALAVVAATAWLFWPEVSGFVDRMRLPTVRTWLVTEAAPATAAAVRGTAANGYVVAARRAALSSDVPGRIVALEVREGSVVEKGDIVARLFADEYRAAWQRTEAELQLAETAIGRAEAAARALDADREQAAEALRTAAAQAAEAATQLAFAERELTRIATLAEQGAEGERSRDNAQSNRDAARSRHQALLAAEASGKAALEAVQQRTEVARLDVVVAQAQRDAARAARDQAKATLDKTDVRAPFDGIVVLKDAEVGEVVSPNVQGGSNARGAVCTMVDFDSLEVQANVPETTLSAVRLGAPADVFLDAFPDDRYDGVVDRIWPTADRQKATVEVRVRLLRKDDRLRPEMGVRIVFRSADEPAPEATRGTGERRIVVPEEAIVQVGGRSGAFVVDRDVVHFAALTLGERKGGRIAVDAGLRAEQRIVLSPPNSLQDGDRVLQQDQ